MATGMLLVACDLPVGLSGSGEGRRGKASGTATRHFEAGAEAHGSPLPEDIARGLSTDARVLECPEGTTGGRSAFAPDWVVAHAVDLDGDGPDDWVVEGRHACLTGPSGPRWWVYAGAPAGARLVGALDEARALEILPARRDGLGDLRLRRADGGDVLLRHDGNAYAPVADPAR